MEWPKEKISTFLSWEITKSQNVTPAQIAQITSEILVREWINRKCENWRKNETDYENIKEKLRKK